MVRTSTSAVVAAFLLTVSAVPAAAQPFVYRLSGSPYVSCNSIFVPVTGCQPPNVKVVNAATGRVIAGVNFGTPGDYAPALALSPDASRIYVVRSVGGVNGPGVLTIIDAVSLTILREVSVGTGFNDVAVAPGGGIAYVSNAGSDSVSVVDLASVAVIKEIPVGRSPRHVVVSPDGASVYVMNYLDHSVSRISAATNAVTATIALTSASFPVSASFSPDGSHLFVANAGGTPAASVANVDTATGAVVGYLDIAPYGRAVDVAAASSTRVFASFREQPAIGGNTGIAVIDPGSNTLVRILLIRSVGELAMDSSRTHLFVSTESGTVIIDAQTLEQREILSVGGGDLAVSPDATPCLFEVTPGNGFVPATGGSGQVTIPAPAGCSWTVRPADSTITFDAPMTGVGPATLSYHVPATTQPRRFDIVIDRQVVTIDQTAPVPSADVAAGPVDQPLHVALWFDRDPTRRLIPRLESAVDVIHAWAFPASGGSPVFVGEAYYSLYGLAGQNSGFNIPVANLPSGRHTLVFYAHDPRTNTFQPAATLDLTVRVGRAAIAVDTPRPEITAISPFVIGGWAVDPAAAAGGGPGIDVVHIWAYPASGGSPIFVAQASTGGPRPDVASLMGSPFSRAGFTTTGSLPSGSYTLALWGRSTGTGTFDAVQTVPITVVQPQPLMYLDTPQACPCTAGRGLFIQGWALDLAATSGTGVTQMQVWATPVAGGAPFPVAELTSMPRPDVAQAFGPQFQQAGFSGIAFLAAGTYDITVYGYSTVRPFTSIDSRTIRVTFQY
jgi:YVTN family beta-propeller protein